MANGDDEDGRQLEDFGEASEETGPDVGTEPAPDPKRLAFAKQVLAGTGFLFVLAAAAYVSDAAFGGDRGKDIFDAGKTILPPIATLVLGYYFSRSS